MRKWEAMTDLRTSGPAQPGEVLDGRYRLEELIGAPVALLSTSPKREDTILVHDPFVD